MLRTRVRRAMAGAAAPEAGAAAALSTAKRLANEADKAPVRHDVALDRCYRTADHHWRQARGGAAQPRRERRSALVKAWATRR